MLPPVADPVHYPKRRKSAGGNPMTRINMTRINAIRTNAARTTKGGRFISWGKNTSALIFAAVLIVCSVTVGCSSSSNQPKPVTANTQIPAPPLQSQSNSMPMPTPLAQPATKPATKKVVPRKPATVNYADKTYGVTFEYPRRYAIETGAAATDLLTSNPIAMNFVAPGGVALAAVELPESSFTNTDFSSAFFDVSVHKSLTADQCTEFAVPQPKVSESPSQTCHPEDRASCGPKDPMPAVATTSSDESSHGNASAPVAASTTASTTSSASPEPSTAAKLSTEPAASPEHLSAAKSSIGSNSKLMLGDLELRATEAVSGEGTRQSDSKYFHVFQNGSCYEFALNVTTDASEEGLVKHVDRDKVFTRLEQILATVKIDTGRIDTEKIDTVNADAVKLDPAKTTAEAPTSTSTETPAQ
jgi:hypothetical protein